jgi:hypothetical protein
MLIPQVRHKIGGPFTVDDVVRRLSCYFWVEERLMSLQGGWMALSPSLEAKAGLGRHLYQDSLHANALHGRIPELRWPRPKVQPNTTFRELMERIDKAPDMLHVLTGIYRVIKPHLLTAYRYHLSVTDDLSDGPTYTMLERIIPEEQAHVTWGQAVIESLATKAETRASLLEFQSELEVSLANSGGVADRPHTLNWPPVQVLPDPFEREMQGGG